MKAKLLLILAFVAVLIACTSPAAETITVRETVEVPVTVEVTRQVERVEEVEVTRLVEVTRIVEITAVPTETPTPAPAAESGEVVAHNYVAEAEVAGVTVQIARVLVANKDAIEQDFSPAPSFDDVDVVGELIFVVRNNSDRTVNVYPFQSTVQINSEVIDLFDYFLADFGDNIGSDIPPDAELIGGQWFGIKRNDLADITEMIVRFGSPSDSESFQSLGNDFEFVIDLSERTFEPVPPELEEALR